MESFLDKVSADLYDKYGSDISKLCLVFPSRRARLFFAESLSKRITKPIWQPETLSISDLIFKWAGKRPSDSLRLLAELYKVYRDLSAEIGDMSTEILDMRHVESSQISNLKSQISNLKSPDSFDRFYHWGEMMLHDFDQVDKYLVPAKALFQNLRDQKMLEGDYSFMTHEQVEAVRMFWSSFSPQKTDLQESFTKMWEVMFPLYDQFKRALEEQGLAYEGMLYRRVAEQEGLCSLDPAVMSYVFIGFNALNGCERTIFRRLQACGLARFYWDRDDYYMDDVRQEAGIFLRKNVQEFPPADLHRSYSDFSKPKEIESWTLPSDVLQTKMVPQLIRDNALHTDKRTAVVLCDESLLIPLVSALPTVTDNINVTMGYPLAKTLVFSFTEALVMLYRSARQHGQSWSYYHIEVSRLLSHPFVSYLSPHAAEDIKKRILAENMPFVPLTLFAHDFWLQAITHYPIEDTDRWLVLFAELLQAVEEAVQQLHTPDPLLLPLLRLVGVELNRYRSSLQSCGLPISVPLFFTLLRHTLRAISVPFSGEPLQGVQVMGILETRTLDFEHVILLSAQEGFLPSAREIPSFIPYNLKASFGLPVKEEHEAIYAYYFYRLLQRAQKVSLLYSVGSDAMQTGEKSRYLLQLSAESPHKITEKRLAMPVILPAPPLEIQREKSGWRQERLLRYTDPDSGAFLTPSAIQAYLQCPLQFCFKYIEQIKEESELLEEADGRGLGTILHSVMESLYTPFLGNTITAAALERILETPVPIREAVEAAIRNHYAPKSEPTRLFEQGRWLIFADVLATYVTQAIKFDLAQTPFMLKAVEHALKFWFSAAPDVLVLLGGVIDRIYEQEGVCYVADYKTGKDQRLFESLESLFLEERSRQNSAVFQMFWYVMLYQQAAPLAKVLPSLYTIRSLFDPAASTLLYDKSAKKEVDNTAPYLERYQTLLGETLSQLFDLSIPFVQTKDREHCTYCSYNQLCGKRALA